MPAPLFVIPPVIRVVFTTVIGTKIVGFVTSWITSPTNHAMRKTYLDHVDHVVEGMGTAGIGIGQTDRVSLAQDLQMLRDSSVSGWTEPHETAALGRTFMFLSKAHAAGLSEGVSSAAASHSKAFGDFVWRTGARAIDAMFPRR